MSLLNLDNNPKTIKGQKQGYRTAILYLAPYKMSQIGNVCPASSPGCRASCLVTAGFGGIYKHVNEVRVERTRQFYESRKAFVLNLEYEIKNFLESVKRESKRKHKKIIPCVRLNGTSDIRWENISFTDKYGITYSNLMERFPYVQFYDYTKISNRKNIPANYHLTFSLSENNDEDAKKAIQNGMNLAVVFKGKLPNKFWDLPVINGDLNDLRFLDPKNIIVGLKAKGRARKDKSGFVKRNEINTNQL